jgi:hypothetical protein
MRRVPHKFGRGKLLPKTRKLEVKREVITWVKRRAVSHIRKRLQANDISNPGQAVLLQFLGGSEHGATSAHVPRAALVQLEQPTLLQSLKCQHVFETVPTRACTNVCDKRHRIPLIPGVDSVVT